VFTLTLTEGIEQLYYLGLTQMQGTSDAVEVLPYYTIHNLMHLFARHVLFQVAFNVAHTADVVKQLATQ
jgi:hypothetical protein